MMASSASRGETPSPRLDPTPSKAWALLAEEHLQQGRVTDFQPGLLLKLHLDDGTTPIFELESAPPVTEAIRAGDQVQVRWFDLWMIMPPSPDEPEVVIAAAIHTDAPAATVTLQTSTGESLTVAGAVQAGDAHLSFLKPGDRVHAERTVAIQEITKVSR
jgi:Zn-dependent alcohol dehydrogenase